jgi:SAM-dependent methyltransferase
MPALTGRIAREGYATLQTKLRPLLHESFELDGRSYPYFFHRTHQTWRSERIVEVAIGRALLERFAGKRVLEIGAVLPQYVDGWNHVVVDKYEEMTGVINEDAETFTAPPFDAILSISTIEHIGWDETPPDPNKIARVIDHLRDLLKPGGTLTVTIPHRWNRNLDSLLETDALPFDRVSYLRRLDTLNHRWRQVERSEAEELYYGYPYVGASAIAVATLTRPEDPARPS